MATERLSGLRVYVRALSGSVASPRVRHARVARVVEIDADSVLLDIGGLKGVRGPLVYVPFSSNLGAHLVAAGVA